MFKLFKLIFNEFQLFSNVVKVMGPPNHPASTPRCADLLLLQLRVGSFYKFLPEKHCFWTSIPPAQNLFVPIKFFKKSIDSGQSHLRLRICAVSIEVLKTLIDSGQSHLRLRICAVWIQLLKKGIDSGQSYLRHKICLFSNEFQRKALILDSHTSESEFVRFQWNP